MMELRQQGWVSPRVRDFDAGEPFVCVELHDVGFGVISKEKHLSQVGCSKLVKLVVSDQDRHRAC